MDSRIAYNCTYLIGFATKYKLPILTNEVQEYLDVILREEATKNQITIHDLIIKPYFVTLKVSFPTDYSLNSVVYKLKNSTSGKLKVKFKKEINSRTPNVWTNEFYASTIGNEDETSLNDFIESRKSRKEVRKS